MRTHYLKKWAVATCIAINLTACATNKIADKELDDYLSQTGTDQSERTVDWYANQKTILENVSTLCFNHFKDKLYEKPTEEYIEQFNNNLYSLYDAIPDCKTVRAAEVKLLSMENTDGKIVDPTQVASIQVELSSAPVRQEISEVSEEVAKHLEQSLKEREQHKQTAIAQINEYTQPGGKVDQILSDTQPPSTPQQ